MSIFSSVRSFFGRVGSAIGGGLSALLGFVSEIFYWFFGIFDFGLGLLGIRPP
jgi:hypothetical protein